MPNWPEFMPAPVDNDIAIGAPIGAALRTSMDAGPAKQRPRFTAAPQPVTLVFKPISAANLAAFETFYKEDLSYGALDFHMQHPITDVVERFRFVASQEPWGMKPIGKDAYRLNVNLERLP